MEVSDFWGCYESFLIQRREIVTFIIILIKQENLVFILVILYIQEYLCTRVSKDFQFQVPKITENAQLYSTVIPPFKSWDKGCLQCLSTHWLNELRIGGLRKERPTLNILIEFIFLAK